jgi:hypothetical protein
MNPKPRPNHRAYLEVLRSMTPGQRLQKALELSELGRALFLEGFLTVVIPLFSVRADDGKPDGAKQPPSAPTTKESAEQAKTPASSAEQQKGMLRDALKLIQSKGARASTAAEDRSPFVVGTWKELEADALKEIGRAQAKLGDIAGARSSWQAALDCIQEMPSYQGPSGRAGVYVEIASAQTEAGEQNEARFTLREALQAARSVKPDPFMPFPPGPEHSGDSQSAKVELLHRIARFQAQAGEPAAADATFRLALETADAVGDALIKVYALLAIAKGGPAEKVTPIWTKALDFALAIKEEYPRAKAVEMVLRARVKASLVDEALATIADRLKGDLQSYAIWAVADAVASSEEKFAPQSMARLAQLAMKAQFDRASKKINVFRRIAEAQARLGDYDGAYRSAGEPHPINDLQTFNATQARLNVMKSVAEAQLKAKDRDAARDTVVAALELIGGSPDEEAEGYFPLEELLSIQARSGDPAGAEKTALSLSSVAWTVYILGQVAEVHAHAGRRDPAQQTIRRAFAEARRAPNEAIWEGVTHAQGGPVYQVPQDAEPLLPLLQTIATAQAKIGDLETAIKTVTDMGDSPGAKVTRGRGLVEIAEARLEAGDTQGALRAAELGSAEDLHGYSNDPLLEKIAKRQAAAGDAAGVLRWAAKQTAPAAKLQALRGLALGIIERIALQNPKPVDPPARAKTAR